MFHGVYDVRMRREQRIGLNFLQSLGDGFLSKGTTDLLEGIERRRRSLRHEVHVGEAAFAEKMLQFEASIVDLELRRIGKAVETVGQRGEEVYKYLGHATQRGILVPLESRHGDGDELARRKSKVRLRNYDPNEVRR